MKYQQVTERERYLLAYLKNNGRSVFQIAFALQRHRSTIYRELKRNQVDYGSHTYRVDRACELARARRYKSRRNSHFSEQEWKSVFRYFIQEDWSPEQLTHRLPKLGLVRISHETIYQRIWKDKEQGGRLYFHLRQFPKRRRKRYRAYDSRGILKGKRHISKRPRAAELRSQWGHFEGDLLLGNLGKNCALTLVDRKTRFAIISKLKDKTMEEVNKKIIPIIEYWGIKTITFDNGTEFHGYKEVETKTGVKCFFATPHHSWERGSIENTNGLIRQYLPKRKSMKGITQQDCNRIMRKLNSRPRKCLNYNTPEECL